MKVLIIDDEPLIRRSLEKVFGKFNHQVLACEDGLKALEVWHEFSPDIAVIDVLMPGKSGPEVIAEAKPNPQIGIILISAYTGEYNPESAKKLGADQFIAKPFEDIVDIVRAAEALHSEKKSMRIIAGKWKGRQLHAFKADHIRPTTDRVKETIFNMIQFEVDGAKILDLFTGTGNLALEALSRGAQSVVAVDSHPKSIALVKKNKAMVEAGDELKIINMDSIKFLQQAQEPFNIITIDPPFTKKMADEVMAAVANSNAVSDGTILFIESSKHEKIEDKYGPMVLRARKNFGDKILSQFVCSS